MRPFKPIQSVKLINRVNVASFDQQVVYLFLEQVILRDYAIQNLLEEFDEASPIIDFFTGGLEEGDGFED